jgi:hypothetical protein
VGIFTRDAPGARELQYARPADNVWRLSLKGRTVVAREPAVYNIAGTDHFRDRVVRYGSARRSYRSKLTGTYVRRASRSC